MARISKIEYETASENVKKVMDQHVAEGYRITNMKKTLLHSITAFQSLEDGFYRLQERLETFLDSRTVTIFGYAISSNDDCLVCSAYFHKLLKDQGIDYETFSFSEKETVLVQFAQELVNNKGHVSDETLDQLQEQFSEQEIVEITSFAALLVANNFFNNALQVNSELLADK